jgi:membrane peptidoglycan carboxypeptidase
MKRTSPFRLPFPRRFLIRIHRDLFEIERYARSSITYPSTLTLLEKMVLVGEDRRFFRHNGIDCKSLIRDFLKALTFRKHGGASTIDMQFVRMATGYYERTLRRKTYEMLLAVLIQFKYSKIEILRYYLKHAFFGSHLYGAKAASETIFGKDPNHLSSSEAATLAAMLVYPCPRKPTERWAANVQRRSKFIEAMLPRFEKSFEKLPRWEAV